MGDNNNHRAGALPEAPNEALLALECLLGTWDDSGGVTGTASFEWMEGGYFLIHRFDGVIPSGRRVKGVEYIGFDEDTQTLRSHLMANDGSNFTYTWRVDGRDVTIWFGDEGAANAFTGTLNEEGDVLTGEWRWPGGGFGVVSRRTGVVPPR